MNASGATEYHFCFLLFVWPNGIERARDDDVRRVDRVHRVGNRVHHVAVRCPR